MPPGGGRSASSVVHRGAARGTEPTGTRTRPASPTTRAKTGRPRSKAGCEAASRADQPPSRPSGLLKIHVFLRRNAPPPPQGYQLSTPNPSVGVHGGCKRAVRLAPRPGGRAPAERPFGFGLLLALHARGHRLPVGGARRNAVARPPPRLPPPPRRRRCQRRRRPAGRGKRRRSRTSWTNCCSTFCTMGRTCEAREPLQVDAWPG